MTDRHLATDGGSFSCSGASGTNSGRELPSVVGQPAMGSSLVYLGVSCGGSGR